MMIRYRRSWQTAYLGIALGASLASMSTRGRAQDAGLEGVCTQSTHPCAERCPAYDTCYISDDAQVYYSVMGRRFECDGLDCDAASATLGDYCCARGEFAPGTGDDDGGGCSLKNPATERHAAGGAVSGLWLGALVVAFAGWRRVRLGGSRAPARRQSGGSDGRSVPR